MKALAAAIRQFFLTTAVVVCLVCPAAADVLVVQSLAIKPYESALQGLKSVSAATVDRIYSSKMNEAEIERYVRKRKPDLIYAIGMDALTKLKSIRDIPLVYLMVLNTPSAAIAGDNTTGINLNISPERQLSVLRQVLPQARKIGLLYDPGKSSPFVAKAHAAVAQKGGELVARPVSSPRDVVSVLNDMAERVNALWLFPDTTVVNPVTVDHLLLTAIEHKIPVFAFSEKYVEKGALLSLEIDEADMGRQAAEMGNRILAGTSVRSVGKEDARSGNVTINAIVAKKLGIPVGSDLGRHFRVIR